MLQYLELVSVSRLQAAQGTFLHAEYSAESQQCDFRGVFFL